MEFVIAVIGGVLLVAAFVHAVRLQSRLAAHEKVTAAATDLCCASPTTLTTRFQALAVVLGHEADNRWPLLARRLYNARFNHAASMKAVMSTARFCMCDREDAFLCDGPGTFERGGKGVDPCPCPCHGVVA